MRYHLSELTRKKALLRVFAAISLSAMIGIVNAETPINKGADNIAIGGYDTVAYFTEGRAVKGRSESEFVWQDTRWFFSSDTHRDLFADAPELYAPQFGGFCAGAMARGVEVKADPKAWTIVGGKLYMKVNKEARDEWREDSAGNIGKADKAWTTLTEQN